LATSSVSNEDEVRRLVSTMPNLSIAYRLPSSSCAAIFVPSITQLAKLSFSEGIFPTRYKTVSVTSLLKKDLRCYHQLWLQPPHHIQNVGEAVHGTHLTTRQKLSIIISRRTCAVTQPKPRSWECWTMSLSVSAAAAWPVCNIWYPKQTDSQPALSYLQCTWHIPEVGRLLPQRTQSVRQSWWSRFVICQLPLRSDEKTRSHYIVNQSVLASCHCSHAVQNIQDTHDSSAKLHSRPTPAAPLITTTQVIRSQSAWNSSDENRFRTTQLPLQRCQLIALSRRYWKRFITLSRIHSFTWPSRLWFRHLTDRHMA